MLSKKKSKVIKFLPYDRILDGIESEDLIDEDDSSKIIRIFNRKKNTKLFMLERTVFTEKEHLTFIKEVQLYESLDQNGLLLIERWSYDMLIDPTHLTKYYRFIIMFDVYTVNLKTYLNSYANKKISMYKEDILKLFRTFIHALYYMYQNEVAIFNPVCPSSFLVCSDTQIRFNAIPVITTKTFLNNIRKERIHFAAPETLQSNNNQIQSNNPQQRFNKIYTETVFSFGILFLQIFLMKPIEGLNQNPEQIKNYLKDVQIRYGDAYKTILQGMLEFDPIKRVHIKDLKLSVENSEHFIVTISQQGPQYTYSEIFTANRKTFIVDQIYKQQIRTIATGIPMTRSILMSNLFDRKKIFLELVDLRIHHLIPEGSVTCVTEGGRIFILGGVISKSVYEFDYEEITFNQQTTLPGCTHNRFAFGYCFHKKSIVIASGLCDHENVREPQNSVAMLDLKTYQWKELPPVCKPAIGCSLIAFNDEHIFKFGGVSQRGNPTNMVERLDKSGIWVPIDFITDRHYPNFLLPSWSVCMQINPAQVLIFGGEFGKNNCQVQTKMLVMNIDTQAHTQDSVKDYYFVEFCFVEINGFFNLSKVVQLQISNNELYLLSRKDEKYYYLFLYSYEEGFKELKKIHI